MSERVRELLRRASAHRDAAPTAGTALMTTAPSPTFEPLTNASTHRPPQETAVSAEGIVHPEWCTSRLRERLGSDLSISPRSVLPWSTDARTSEREVGVLKQTTSFQTFVGV